MAKAKSTQTKRPRKQSRGGSGNAGVSRSAPVMAVTRYEQVSSLLIAIAIAMILTTAILGALWAATLESDEGGPAEMELVELAGGVEDGSPDETLKVESPEEEIDDPALTEEETEESEIEEVFENVVELSDNAAEQVEQQFETQAENSGKVGSRSGTGSRPLGSGPGEGGVPRHQRWFIRFGEGGSTAIYAKQLDFFGIELGALFPAQKKLVYVSNFSGTPRRRQVQTGQNEKRLYMNWQSGSLRKTDHKLFQKIGIDTKGGMILHFYPKKTEESLAQLERGYRNRKVKTIRRTVFTVRSRGRGFHFVVTRQTYFR